ncbi:Lipase precursor [Mycobacterium numidiamassiliense]|uniref:Lipase n=1 Tax=Mycobacterium numidiamassiliense TaxID=1841861 RepID=A0A2U3PC35_9MYCO|nr:alpha/beta fold hydrolase [Mycobacterium numidiamassiliense]SPM41334.1 Lipase precursor [Mycobacterium numidiamassiliense]
MRRTLAIVTAVTVAATTMVVGCGGSDDKRAQSHAVVIVSGGDATSPFTTPSQACATGLAAGNTDTALREYLLKQSYQVFTSPAMAGRGQVVDQTGFGSFGVCPVTLPENMTVNSTGSIDTAGEHLARFLTYLHTEKGIDEVDLVGHSMGGLYSRAAIRVLTTTTSPVRIRSLTTIGTPWQGSYLSDYANDIVALTDCAGDQFCENAMKGFKAEVLRLMSGSGREVNQAYLMGKDGWNQFQSGVLDKIPVVLIAGKKFTKSGPVNPMVWPNDGIVALRSALAVDITDPVLPHRLCHTFDDTHSIYVSDAAGLDWKTALTWDPQVFDVLHSAIENAPKALGGANREGCPTS